MRYRYFAKDGSGRGVKGVVEAGSKIAAAQIIREQKLTPVSIDEGGKSLDLGAVKNMFGKVGAGELSTFTRQLATMINAGLPLTDALSLLKVQTSPKLSKVVGGILADIQAGVSLSSSMAKHPDIFSTVYIALVKAGEAAGIMETILNRLADNTEKSRELKSKVTGAMIYPAIILLAMAGVVAVVMVAVIPQMKNLYADFNTELPFATRMLIGVSDFMIHQWWVIFLAIAGLIFVVPVYLKTKNGREKWDGVLYKTPVVGPLAEKMMLTEVARTMSLLIGAGVSVVEAINIVAEGAGNVIVRRELLQIAKKVEKGFPVSISFSECPLFPPIVGQMMAVGEETGKMDDVLAKVARYFESESEEKIKGLTTAIEPIILIIMAVGVGFLMYAVIMPMYSIMDKI